MPLETDGYASSRSAILRLALSCRKQSRDGGVALHALSLECPPVAAGKSPMQIRERRLQYRRSSNGSISDKVGARNWGRLRRQFEEFREVLRD